MGEFWYSNGDQTQEGVSKVGIRRDGASPLLVDPTESNGKSLQAEIRDRMDEPSYAVRQFAVAA